MPQPAGEFSARLRRALDSRGRSLSWVHEQLHAMGHPIGRTTLTYWKNGERTPHGGRSLQIVDVLEDLLDLTPGTLAEALAPVPRLGRVSDIAKPYQDEELCALVESVVARHQPGALENLRQIQFHAAAEAGPSGEVRRLRVDTVIQVLRTPTDASIGLSLPPVPTEVVPELTVLAGAADMWLEPVLGGRVHVIRARLERTYDPGEEFAVSFLRTFPAAHPRDMKIEQSFVRRVRSVSLMATFAEAPVPDWIESYETGGGPDRVTDIRAQRTVHVARGSFGPGVIGLRWGSDL
ncbi:hypothetical protein [Brachybacterium hainanense]|uniref:XRE family transcriptional regulator n=1 Tax=Brachybacterium hainanense TaxID=1541174 RepID=A0ABV6R9Q2_9MICO